MPVLRALTKAIKADHDDRSAACEFWYERGVAKWVVEAIWNPDEPGSARLPAPGLAGSEVVQVLCNHYKIEWRV